VRKYNPLLEYGGWGIRGVSKIMFLEIGKISWVHHIKGIKGIEIEHSDGGKILFGTQDPDSAQKTIGIYKSKICNLFYLPLM